MKIKGFLVYRIWYAWPHSLPAMLRPSVMMDVETIVTGKCREMSELCMGESTVVETPPSKRRCVDCIYFRPDRVKARERDNYGNKHKAYLYGCDKRQSGYICYWVRRISDLNIYDDMLACFKPIGQLEIKF